MSSYGETMRFEDGIYDLGAVCDETLFWLREEMETALGREPGYYYCTQHRDEDEENLANIEHEIYWRYRTGTSLDEDLDGSWRCNIGCCD